MSDYRRDFGHLSREVYWTVPRVFLWGLFGFVLLGLFAWIGSVLLAPTKVFDPNNIKANYEWFHDVSRDQKARVQQIKTHRELIKAETDRSELSRLRVELGGMQAACRELVARYNSRAAQIHRGIFQGTSVPATLDAASCD